MNIRIPYSWLLEYLDTKATPSQIQKYLSLCGPSVESIEKIGDDHILNIEITSNRIDTVSLYGIAREAAAILSRFGIKSRLKELKLLNLPKTNNNLQLKLVDEKKIFRRMLAIVMNVKVGASPKYISSRLEKAGVRSLNNLIDVTNYVMLEVGFPTHVFDFDRIKTSTLKVRHARDGEHLTTLDDKKCKLIPDDVVIEDGTGRIIDLPGIMGTANSVVTSKTRRIIFFIDVNDPVLIRKTSMRLALRSMAATINEKEPDSELAKTAMLRGIELFQKIAEAEIVSNLYDIYPRQKKVSSIAVSTKFVNERLGVKLNEKEMIKILEDLDFSVIVKNSQFIIRPPSFRSPDVRIAEDIVEEIARIYGYHNLPNNISPMVYVKQPPELEKLFSMQNKIKYFLKHLGLNEVMNYSMLSKELLTIFDLKPEDHLRIKNTISEEIEYMRKHLTISLLKNLKDNEGKKNDLRFFEIAKIYLPQLGTLPKEEYRLGLATNTSLEDLKGIIDALFSELHIVDVRIEPGDLWLFAEGQRGKILVNNIVIGEFGKLKPVYKLKQGLKSDAYLAYFKFEQLIDEAKPIAAYIPINPFATIKLDLTVTFSSKKNYSNFRSEAFKISKLLKKMEVIDRFEDKVTVRFYFASLSRNIKEADAKTDLEMIKALMMG